MMDGFVSLGLLGLFNSPKEKSTSRTMLKEQVSLHFLDSSLISEAEGRVHFVSTRQDKFSKWEIVEWTVTSYANGNVVSLMSEDHEIPVPEEVT